MITIGEYELDLLKRRIIDGLNSFIEYYSKDSAGCDYDTWMYEDIKDNLELKIRLWTASLADFERLHALFLKHHGGSQG